ncbi:MAG: hypothetical protein AAF360_08610 [Pseudomonadota bacterium]
MSVAEAHRPDGGAPLTADETVDIAMDVFSVTCLICLAPFVLSALWGGPTLFAFALLAGFPVLLVSAFLCMICALVVWRRAIRRRRPAQDKFGRYALVPTIMCIIAPALCIEIAVAHFYGASAFGVSLIPLGVGLYAGRVEPRRGAM